MKVLSKTDIDRIIKESIEEITRKGQPVATQQISVPDAKTPKNDKLVGKPYCSSAFYSKPDANGEEFMTVRIYGIHGVHQNALMQEWKQKYGQIFSSTVNQAQKMGTAAAPMDLIIQPGQEDAFVQIIPSIVQDIASQNGVKNMSYDGNYLQSLQTSIIGRMDEAPSEEELEKAQERQRMNIKDIIMKLSDPDFVKKLGFVGGISNQSYSNLKDIVKQGNSVGWRISPLNQLMVKSYLPMATFVTNAWTWDHVFNREVIDTTQFALEVKSANNKPKDINSRIQAAANLGYIDKANAGKNPYDVYRSIKSNLSQSQRLAVDFLANILNPHSADFTRQKVYDISNTRLKTDANGNPMYDVFNQEVNYADNIQGIPNAEAQKYLAQNDGTDTSTQSQQIQWTSKSDTEIADIINILRALCSRDCGSVPNTVAGDSLGDTIAHFASYYAEHHICPNRGIVVPAIRTETSNIIAIALAAVFGFNVQRRAGNMAGLLKDPNFEKKLNDLYQDFCDLVSDINVELLKLSNSRMKGKKKAVEESINEEQIIKPISFEQFIDIAKGNDSLMEEEDVEETSVEQLEESFFNMLDRMNHIYE